MRPQPDAFDDPQMPSAGRIPARPQSPRNIKRPHPQDRHKPDRRGKLPKQVRLLRQFVGRGSQTPSMGSKVLSRRISRRQRSWHPRRTGREASGIRRSVRSKLLSQWALSRAYPFNRVSIHEQCKSHADQAIPGRIRKRIEARLPLWGLAIWSLSDGVIVSCFPVRIYGDSCGSGSRFSTVGSFKEKGKRIRSMQ